MKVIITDPHELAIIREEELDKIFIDGRGHDTKLKEHTRKCYDDGSLREMPEQTRGQIRERTKAALTLAQETIEFVRNFGLLDNFQDRFLGW